LDSRQQFKPPIQVSSVLFYSSLGPTFMPWSGVLGVLECTEFALWIGRRFP
jgi:hypothetical protein